MDVSNNVYILCKSCVIFGCPLVVADFGRFSDNTLSGTNIAFCPRTQVRGSINVIVGLKVGL
jgi:hypothetical protein